MAKVNLYQRMKEDDGYVRGMYKPDEAGIYLVKHNSDEFITAYFNGEFWEDKVERLICWMEIPKCDIDAPF